MKVTIHIKDSNYLLARAELVSLEEDAKSKRAVVVAAEKNKRRYHLYRQSTLRQPAGSTCKGCDKESF